MPAHDGGDDAGRVAALTQLVNFAVRQGYDGLGGPLLTRLYTLIDTPVPLAAAGRAELDDLTIELSKITYPVNVTNVGEALEGSLSVRFVYAVIACGLIAAVAAGLQIWAVRRGILVDGAATWLALTLGFLGAVVHVMLPNGRLNLYLGIDAANRANSVVRVVMGALLGFVLALVIVPVDTPSIDPKYLLVPLLGGYSITLVVGVLAKAINAVQLTLNIDTKQIQASLQK